MNSILDALWWWSCTQIHVSFQVTALGIVTSLGAVRWEEGVVALLYWPFHHSFEWTSIFTIMQTQTEILQGSLIMQRNASDVKRTKIQLTLLLLFKNYFCPWQASVTRTHTVLWLTFNHCHMQVFALRVVGEREVELWVNDWATCCHPITQLSATGGVICGVWDKNTSWWCHQVHKSAICTSLTRKNGKMLLKQTGLVRVSVLNWITVLESFQINVMSQKVIPRSFLSMCLFTLSGDGKDILWFVRCLVTRITLFGTFFRWCLVV